MKRALVSLPFFLIIGWLLLACSQQTVTVAPPEEVEFTPEMLAAFEPLPSEVPHESHSLTEERINLGRMLFYETRLSISQEMSCNSCHSLDAFGVDGRQFSLGHEGKPVGRNSPTVYNAALHVAQFWDGRSPDVEDQALGPILAGGEMGMPDPEHVLKVLNSIPGYEPLFAAAFPDDENPITYENVGIAIGAFERRLLTPSRFDAFLEGAKSELNQQEKRGLATFVETGCAGCHNGAAVGGGSFQKIGVATPFETEDVGRFEVTGDETDMHVFKVPSLRNIAETGPYLHDGSVETLEEMVQLMAKHQLGQTLSDEEVADIVAFLNTLTGEIPMDYIQEPELPASGPDTPGPYEGE